MATVGEIERYVTGGGTVACAKCKAPTPPEDAFQVTMRLVVEPIAAWQRRGASETIASVLTPLCGSCKDKVVPDAGVEIQL